MKLISSKIAKHVNVPKFFASIALRTVGLQQLWHYDVTTHCYETLALAFALWCASDHFLMLRSYLVKNNSVLTAFQMDKTTLNAQVVITGVKRIFYQLKSVDRERSDLWKDFGLVANRKNERLEFTACLTCLRALWVGQVFATSFTPHNSFWNTQNLYTTTFEAGCKNFTLQLFSFLHATFIK